MEGTNDLGSATKAAHFSSDGLAEDLQVGRAETAEGVLLLSNRGGCGGLRTRTEARQ